MSVVPVFYFDLASPYAYLAAQRIDSVLGADVAWQPILVGALHKHYRRASWGVTPESRARGIAEIERRAEAYGLAPIKWPDPYPANTLTAMRAAVWAQQAGEARAFALAAYALAFVEGLDLTGRSVVLEAARNAGLDADDLERGLDDPAIKQALRDANDSAIATHVYGVPTVDAGGMLWWGDEQLEAAQLARQHG